MSSFQCVVAVVCVSVSFTLFRHLAHKSIAFIANFEYGIAYPTGNYLLKVNNENNRTMYKICSLKRLT